MQWLADCLHAKERLQQSWKKIRCEGFRDICCLCDVLLEPIKVYSTRCWVDFLLCIAQDAMFGIMQIVYINISCRTSRWIRPSRFPTNTPPVPCHRFGYFPALPPCLVSFLIHRPSSSCLWPPSHSSTFCCHPNAVKQSFAPSLLTLSWVCVPTSSTFFVVPRSLCHWPLPFQQLSCL